MKLIKKLLIVLSIVIAVPAVFFAPPATTQVSAASLSGNRLTMTEGEEYSLSIPGVSGKITWKSKNKKIATVNKKGNVRAYSAGTTKIIAKYGGTTKKFKLTVKAKGNTTPEYTDEWIETSLSGKNTIRNLTYAEPTEWRKVYTAEHYGYYYYPHKNDNNPALYVMVKETGKSSTSASWRSSFYGGFINGLSKNNSVIRSHQAVNIDGLEARRIRISNNSSVGQTDSLTYAILDWNADIFYAFSVTQKGQLDDRMIDTVERIISSISIRKTTDTNNTGNNTNNGQTPTSSLTASQRNAIASAQSYLKVTSFSRKELIEQLEYEKYSTADAAFAVDYLNVDWNAQAVKSAKAYLRISSFSYSELVEQLEYEGFTHDQAIYGVSAAYK